VFRFFHAVFLLLLATTATQAQVSILGSATNPDNGHLYHILTNSTWTDAEAFAVSLGGHLVTINNVAENTWVANTFSQYGSINRALWIGINDAAIEGTFVWSSGEAVTYTNWAPGEPNNAGGNEDYGYIIQPGNPTPLWPMWNDFPNTPDSNGIVEIAAAMTYWQRTRSRKRSLTM